MSIFSQSVPNALFSVTGCFQCPLSMTVPPVSLIYHRLHSMHFSFLTDCAPCPFLSHRMCSMPLLSDCIPCIASFSQTVPHAQPLHQRLLPMLTLSHSVPNAPLSIADYFHFPFLTYCSLCPQSHRLSPCPPPSLTDFSLPPHRLLLMPPPYLTDYAQFPCPLSQTVPYPLLPHRLHPMSSTLIG